MTSKQKKHILYVDDEQQNLIAFQLAFKKFYQVHIANSAQEGIELLKEYPIKVVLTDQMMPEMTGVEFLEQIIPEHEEVIRMVLTAYSDPKDIIEMINKGKIYQFIAKPWQKASLKVILENAIQTYDLKYQNQELLQQLKTANSALEQKVEERTQALSLSNQQLTSKNQMIELLLREVNHRVINKLNILKVLISQEIEHTTEVIFQEKLQRLESKVIDLSSIHRQLMYGGDNKRKTSLQAYFNDIVKILNQVYQDGDQQIQMGIHLEDVQIPQNQAYFLGFILYELLTNSFKYAGFSDVEAPAISIELNQTREAQFVLIYQDNGVGLPEELFENGAFLFAKLDSLGLRIVALITKIHQGDFEIIPNQTNAEGASFICRLNFEPSNIKTL